MLVQQNFRDFARRLQEQQPRKRVQALKAVRQVMRERFMKVFAYFRLKKYNEPLVCNLSRPDFAVTN